MGQPAARLGDMDSGHACFAPRKNLGGSTNVFVNGKPWHRQGDPWPVHCCGSPPSCHPSMTSGGSSGVRVNGRPAARVTDQSGCGGVIITGSGNVFAG